VLKPGRAQCDVSCLTVPGESSSDCDFSGSPVNVRDYLVNNGYTLWLLLSGPNGGKSLKGSAETQYTDGGVYQAMNIIKKILDLTQAKVGSVRAALHGYSMGPVVLRAGLRHWCDLGTWESAALGDLRLPQSDCYNIGVWFSGTRRWRARSRHWPPCATLRISRSTPTCSLASTPPPPGRC